MPTYEQFFQAATGNQPHDYQKRLAASPSESRLINIPTGLGKTAAVVLSWLWNRVHDFKKHKAALPKWIARMFCVSLLMNDKSYTSMGPCQRHGSRRQGTEFKMIEKGGGVGIHPSSRSGSLSGVGNQLANERDKERLSFCVQEAFLPCHVNN